VSLSAVNSAVGNIENLLVGLSLLENLGTGMWCFSHFTGTCL